jgi:HSP20 family protein
MLYDTKNYNKRRSLNEGFWDDFTNRDVMQDYRVHGPVSSPAVNILEREDEYRIELIAPGLCRDNYSIQLHDDILRISGEIPSEKDNENETYARREYYARDFERSFVLPRSVDKDKIAASCNDGILTVHVPVRRREDAQNKRRIDIQ